MAERDPTRSQPRMARLCPAGRLVVAPGRSRPLRPRPRGADARRQRAVAELPLGRGAEARPLADPWASSPRSSAGAQHRSPAARRPPTAGGDSSRPASTRADTVARAALGRSTDRSGWPTLLRPHRGAGVDPDERGASRLGGDAASAVRAAAARDRRPRRHAAHRRRSCASSMRRAARPAAGSPFRCARSATVGGRPMLGGLKLLLNAFRLHNDAPERRLPALLQAEPRSAGRGLGQARRAGARRLHELLRGLHAADAGADRAPGDAAARIISTRGCSRCCCGSSFCSMPRIAT